MKAVQNFHKIADTGVSSWISEECKKLKIIYATPIQQTIIPVVISGKYSIAFSRTGTGKTLSFILPVLHIHQLNYINSWIGIIVPTVELGIQIYEIYNYIGRAKKISSTFLEKIFKKQLDMKKKNNCLISSTFRFFKNLENLYHPNQSTVRVLILDETDLLFNPRNFCQIKKIFMKIKPTQINLFGVTNIKILKHIGTFQYRKNIFFFQEKCNSFSLFSEVKHEYIYCSLVNKFRFLLILLKYREKIKYCEKTLNPILIFSRDLSISEKFDDLLKKNNFSVSKLNHKMSIYQRILSIQMVRKKISNILISTDLGSRGVNFPSINLIINLDLPVKVEDYVHRTGRIGRYRKKGYCLNLIDKDEICLIQNIEKNTGIRINKSNLNGNKDIFKEVLGLF